MVYSLLTNRKHTRFGGNAAPSADGPALLSRAMLLENEIQMTKRKHELYEEAGLFLD